MTICCVSTACDNVKWTRVSEYHTESQPLREPLLELPWRKYSLCQMVLHCGMLCHRSVGLLLSSTESTVRDVSRWFDREAERRRATFTCLSFISGTTKPRFHSYRPYYMYLSRVAYAEWSCVTTTFFFLTQRKSETKFK